MNDDIIAVSSATDMWTFPTVSGTAKVVQYGLHWNGKSWSKSTFGNLSPIQAAAFSVTNAWVFGDGPATVPTLGFGPPAGVKSLSSTANGYIAHYSDGHWSYQAASAESGCADIGPKLISIPGTKSSGDSRA